MKKGFTLIELLVVISLLGILATLVMANLNTARERSRDAQRKSGFRNIQTALRLYYNDFGVYPSNVSGGQIVGCGNLGTTACAWGAAWDAGSNTYMTILPGDPLPSQAYSYEVSADSESYTLTACLENKSDDKGVATVDPNCPSAWVYQVSP